MHRRVFSSSPGPYPGIPAASPSGCNIHIRLQTLPDCSGRDLLVQLQADLGDTAGPVPDHCSKVSITVK